MARGSIFFKVQNSLKREIEETLNCHNCYAEGGVSRIGGGRGESLKQSQERRFYEGWLCVHTHAGTKSAIKLLRWTPCAFKSGWLVFLSFQEPESMFLHLAARFPRRTFLIKP